MKYYKTTNITPIVALIGRPNVGKSTLFNCLTHTHNALVSNISGCTRDRKFGYVKNIDYEFICIDTGGIISLSKVEKEIKSPVIKQSLEAIKEANLIFFIVDAKSGIMSDDLTISKYLHFYNKPTFLVVNKIDGIDINQSIVDFWSLGFRNIFPVSSSNSIGIRNLLETTSSFLISKIVPVQEVNKNIKYLTQFELKVHETKIQNLPIKLAIVGRPNVGKSTLTNSFLGKDQVIVCDMPGTTRDSIDILMKYNQRKYIIIDTAGIHNRKKNIGQIEKLSVIKSFQSIEIANVVLLVIDATEGISDQDLSLLKFILNNGRSLVIAINKWDSIDKDTKKHVKEIIKYRLHFINFVRIRFISASKGIGVNSLFKFICEAYDNSTTRVSTAILTKIMNTAVMEHQPPLVRGRRINFKYAHSGGYNPLIVVIHSNIRVKNIPDSYKRYLINYFQKSLNLKGTQVCIQFKTKHNPFLDKKQF